MSRVGRPGDGPMEFDYPAPTHVDGRGLVHVRDLRRPRITVVQPDFQVARTVRLPAIAHQAERLPMGDRWVVNMTIRSAQSLGLPLHIVEGSDLVRSFPTQDHASSQALGGIAMRRLLAIDRGERIISARIDDFVFEAWTLDGRRIGGFRGPHLNEIEPRPGPMSEENPPGNKIVDIRIDGGGLLWVASIRAKRDWLDRVEEVVRRDGTIYLEPIGGDLASLFTSRIDVVDLNRGAIIARSEREGMVASLLADRLALTHELTTEGVPQLGVWSLSFHQQ